MGLRTRTRRMAFNRLSFAFLLIHFGPCIALSESAFAREAPEKHLQELRSQSARLVVRTSHTGSIDCLAFSPDGRRVLTGGFDGMVRHWDLKTG